MSQEILITSISLKQRNSTVVAQNTYIRKCFFLHAFSYMHPKNPKGVAVKPHVVEGTAAEPTVVVLQVIFAV